jgi:hypothetical protein
VGPRFCRVLCGRSWERCGGFSRPQQWHPEESLACAYSVLRGVSCVLRLADGGHHAQLPEKLALGPVTRLLSSTDEQLKGQHDEKIQHERNQLRANLLSIEYINTINKGLLIYHVEHACPTMKETDYIKFLKKSVLEEAHRLPQEDRQPAQLYYPRIHTLFSGEFTPYFDWQTVGLVHSFKHNF